MKVLALILDHVGGLELENEVKVPLVVKSTFHMHVRGNLFEDTCVIKPFEADTLDRCNYNTSNPLVIIIHGWTVRTSSNLYFCSTSQRVAGLCLLGKNVYWRVLHIP